jgi:hypothetical protein
MNGISLRLIAAAIAVGALTSATTAAGAPLTCDALIGNPGNGECQITKPHHLGNGGTFTVDRVLHIIGPKGELRVNGGATLDLTVTGHTDGTSYGLVIDSGGRISGEANGANGVGATLNIAADSILLAASGATISAANNAVGQCKNGRGGVINIHATQSGLSSVSALASEAGTTISVNGGSCPAGAISIFSGAGKLEIGGNVLAQNDRIDVGTGIGAGIPPVGGTQLPGGGPIFIKAGCHLTILDTGVISSRGSGSGADLVHLEGGCHVFVNGVVESTDVGDAIPGNPPNSCSNVTPHAGSVRRNPATRPGKPFNSTACVEVWAGHGIVISRHASGHNGEIRADIGSGSASAATSWIELFARSVTVDNRDATGAAVHANNLAAANGSGGAVTIKSDLATLNGLSLQANATGPGGAGGNVVVQAGNLVDLTGSGSLLDGVVEAKGASSGSAHRHGGQISLSAGQNILAGASAKLDVTGGAPPNGVVNLSACPSSHFNPIAFPPGTVVPAQATVNKTLVCPAPVTLPTYFVEPTCDCGGGCRNTGFF